MTDTDAYLQRMAVSNPLVEPTVYSAIQALQLPSGSRGLDAGCGIGLQALLLAEAVGPTGHVTGLDISPEFLSHAEEIVKKSGLSEQISFQEGDVRELPFDDDTFDWAWSSSCVGYSASLEPLSVVRELARVVKPGGSVAIFAWSSERLLPGYPLLEARLTATSSGIAPFVKGKRPELHFLRALGWFRDAGLEEPTARTCAGGAYAPLSDDLRNALIALFEMRWPSVESELTQEDWSEYQRLCLPESPEFILNHPDYYAFFTCSMFCGKVAKWILFEHFILKLYPEGEVGMKQETKETLGYVVNGLSFALFFYLASILDVPDVSPPIKYLAWILLGFGLVLIVLSIATLVSNREAGLIEWGIYGIVRHPMYLGAMVLFLSWIFFLPHWIIVLISSVNIAIVYWFILQGERQNITKFGDIYRRYMETVPRINLLAGLIRRLQSK